jgi:hypothetical protein
MMRPRLGGMRRPRLECVRQRLLPFQARRERRDRLFRRAIVVVTGLALAGLLVAMAPGWGAIAGKARETKWSAMRRIGLEPAREEVDASLKERRSRREVATRERYRVLFARLTPERQAFLRLAGMGPDEAVVRWGNYDMTFVLSSKVFAEDPDRQYRLLPKVRSVCIRQMSMFDMDTCQFIVPETPEVLRAAEAAGAVPVAGTEQATNSWGCRGPEPDVNASVRGLVLGDSFMQGYFVTDDDTPPQQLQRSLAEILGERVAILNTGVLGYEPEHEYHALRAYAERFRPRFVIVATFVNDFGEEAAVLRGEGDWVEPAHWLEKIQEYCRSKGILCLFAPVPWEGQLRGLRNSGDYPGRVANIARADGPYFCDATEAFVGENLVIQAELRRAGRPMPERTPLYNGALGDGHFSPRGSALWGRFVAERLALLLGQRRPAPATSAAETAEGRSP